MIPSIANVNKTLGKKNCRNSVVGENAAIVAKMILALAPWGVRQKVILGSKSN
jgi:hypothetical protein